MDESRAVSVLSEVKKILDYQKIEFWLESGTLLGAIRENKFIEWDYDIDLGTSEKYMNKMEDLAKVFKSNGFECYYSLYHHSMGLWKRGISIDIPFWRFTHGNAILPLKYAENLIGKVIFYFEWLMLYSCPGKLGAKNSGINYRVGRYFFSKSMDILPPALKIIIAAKLRRFAILTGNRRGLVVTPSRFFKNLSYIEFYNEKYRVPKHSDEYLSYYFGSDWMIPKKNWNYIEVGESVLSETEHVGPIWINRNPMLTT